VRIAALISVQRLVPHSATALSLLVICRTIPELSIAPFGGVLADTYDRKKLMISLDIMAAFSVYTFIYAVRSGNVLLLYFAAVIRSIIGAIYMPITSAIVPMIVNDPEDLNRAATLNGMAWSGMLIVGGVIAGGTAARFGVETCFYIDSLTYFMSALIMSKVSGSFMVESTTTKKETTAKMLRPISAFRSFLRMNLDFIEYLWTCNFGGLIFLKASGCLIYGSADVLNVILVHVEGDEAETSRLMGRLFSFIGFGCMIGPMLANSTIVYGDKPRTLQISIVFGLFFMTAGWLGIARNITSFEALCVFSCVRTIGSGCVWVFSTLLLQNLTSSRYMGRVLALDFCLARVAETCAAFVAGRLEDNGRSNSEIAYFSTGVAGSLFVFWCTYHNMRYGAARSKFNNEGGTQIIGEQLEALI